MAGRPNGLQRFDCSVGPDELADEFVLRDRTLQVSVLGVLARSAMQED
jgi:hypothetical protein